MPISFTAHGYIELWRGDIRISQHRLEREAIERASVEPGDYVLRYPEVAVRVIGSLATSSSDTQAPTTPSNLQATVVNKSRVDLSWAASTDNVGVSGYQVFRDGSPLTTTVATSHSDTTAQPSTTYSYTVAAFDAAGNVSGVSAAAQATTPANAAPVWSAIPAQSLIVGDAYQIDLDDYCTDADLETVSYSVILGTLPTGLTLSGGIISGTPTTAGQSATLTIRATDQFATVDTTADFETFDADVTAPPVPTGLAGTAASDSQVDLSWNASTDAQGAANEYVSGTQDYRLFRDGALRATVTAPTTSYSDTGLSADTQYEYAVAARDASLNQSVLTSSIFVNTQVVDPIITGAFHYDPVNGNDNNNGILVGEVGTGATFNGTPGTGARQTVAQFQTDYAAGRYRPGDLIYIHPPGLVFTNGFVIRSNSTVDDPLNKMVTRSLPGQKANTLLDLATNAITLPGGQGANPISCLHANIVFQSFLFTHRGSAWGAGNQTGQGAGSGHGCQWIDLDGTRVGAQTGGDNGGVWKLQDICENFVVVGCTVSSAHPPSATSNFALAYWIGAQTGLWGYNDFAFDGTAAGGIGGPLMHHKRSIGVTLIEIRNNMLRRVGGRSGSGRNDWFHGGGTANHRLSNNIWYGESSPSFSWGMSGGTSGSDPTCSDMDFEHETFYGGGLAMVGVNGVAGAGRDNLVRSCVLDDMSLWSQSLPGPIQNTGFLSDYNHGDAGARYIRYFGSDYTLAQWQAIASGDTGQDVHTVNEAVQFNTTPDATDVTTFRLAAGSAGKNAAHDGTDIGADVDQVGPAAMPTSYFWVNGTTKRS